MTRLGSARYMRGSIGFLLLVEHSLAVVEAREHTIPKLARSQETDGALIRYKTSGPPVSSPGIQSVHEQLRAAGDQMDCFICTGCGQSGKVSKMVNSSVALLRSRRDVW